MPSAIAAKTADDGGSRTLPPRRSWPGQGCTPSIRPVVDGAGGGAVEGDGSACCQSKNGAITRPARWAARTVSTKSIVFGSCTAITNAQLQDRQMRRWPDRPSACAYQGLGVAGVPAWWAVTGARARSANRASAWAGSRDLQVHHFCCGSALCHQVSGKAPVSAVAADHSIRFQRAIHWSATLNRGIA